MGLRAKSSESCLFEPQLQNKNFKTMVNNGARPAIPPAGQLPGRPGVTLPRYIALMQRCWAGDPGRRPSFREILTELEAMQCAEMDEAREAIARQQGFRKAMQTLRTVDETLPPTFPRIACADIVMGPPLGPNDFFDVCLAQWAGATVAVKPFRTICHLINAGGERDPIAAALAPNSGSTYLCSEEVRAQRYS